VKLEACAVGITAGSREVPGRNAFDRRHTYCIIIIIIINSSSTNSNGGGGNDYDNDGDCENSGDAFPSAWC